MLSVVQAARVLVNSREGRLQAFASGQRAGLVCWLDVSVSSRSR